MNKKESNNDHSIFKKEEDILNNAVIAFDESERSMSILMDNFSSITKSYKKLLRQVKQLTKVSDAQQKKLRDTQEALDIALHKSDTLLLNVLPKDIAEELKENGKVKPRKYYATVLFTDFKGFTMISEKMTPEELVASLDECFESFDNIVKKHNLEKIKTIGDSYMCVGGIPLANKTHPIDTVLAGLDMAEYISKMQNKYQKRNKKYWDIRIGIHSGEVVAGVIGKSKFAYDVWGDSVNTASRMESSGIAGKVNISNSTYKLVSNFFECKSRGLIEAKNKGQLEMFQVERIKTELSQRSKGIIPNKKFNDIYNALTDEN